MSDHLVPPRLTPGRLVYLCVHRPAGALASVFKNGGPWVQWRTARGERDMIIAAATLPALVFSQQEPACELHLLTGRRYTAHFSVANELPDLLADQRVVTDGNLLTSRGAGTALDFGLLLVEKLFSPAKSVEIAYSVCADIR